MTVRELLNDGEKVLSEAGLQEAKEEARLLYRELFTLSFSELLLSFQEEAADEQRKIYEEALKKRAMHIPLQHITGHAPFYGREFLVSKDVLIPRFDTEILVEETLKELRSFAEKEHPPVPSCKTYGEETEDGHIGLLDLCTGSGCIGITLKLEMPKLSVTCTDLSLQALRIAEKNAKKLQASVDFLQGDLFQPVQGRFQVIVSNPPYIKTAEIKALDEEVKAYDPYMALSGGEDGLDFYRRIAGDAGLYLTEKGVLLLEIGEEQGADVACLFRNAGFSSIQIVKDLAGLDRVVIIKR